MGMSISETALTNAFYYLRTKLGYGTATITFSCYAGATEVDSVTLSVNCMVTASPGVLTYQTSTYGNIVFTIPPSTTGVDSVKLISPLQVGGTQVIGSWSLTSPGLDYPNGGTLSLSQFILSAITE